MTIPNGPLQSNTPFPFNTPFSASFQPFFIPSTSALHPVNANNHSIGSSSLTSSNSSTITNNAVNRNNQHLNNNDIQIPTSSLCSNDNSMNLTTNINLSTTTNNASSSTDFEQVINPILNLSEPNKLHQNLVNMAVIPSSAPSTTNSDVLSATTSKNLKKEYGVLSPPSLTFSFKLRRNFFKRPSSSSMTSPISTSKNTSKGKSLFNVNQRQYKKSHVSSFGPPLYASMKNLSYSSHFTELEQSCIIHSHDTYQPTFSDVFGVDIVKYKKLQQKSKKAAEKCETASILTSEAVKKMRMDPMWPYLGDEHFRLENFKGKPKLYAHKACVNCKASHVACDSNRPCSRCVKLGKEDTCIDAVRKKRGRPTSTNKLTSSFSHPLHAQLEHQHRHQLLNEISATSASAQEPLLTGFSMNNVDSNSSLTFTQGKLPETKSPAHLSSSVSSNSSESNEDAHSLYLDPSIIEDDATSDTNMLKEVIHMDFENMTSITTTIAPPNTPISSAKYSSNEIVDTSSIKEDSENGVKEGDSEKKMLMGSVNCTAEKHNSIDPLTSTAVVPPSKAATSTKMSANIATTSATFSTTTNNAVLNTAASVPFVPAEKPQVGNGYVTKVTSSEKKVSSLPSTHAPMRANMLQTAPPPSTIHPSMFLKKNPFMAPHLQHPPHLPVPGHPSHIPPVGLIPGPHPPPHPHLPFPLSPLPFLPPHPGPVAAPPPPGAMAAVDMMRFQSMLRHIPPGPPAQVLGPPAGLATNTFFVPNNPISMNNNNPMHLPFSLANTTHATQITPSTVSNINLTNSSHTNLKPSSVPTMTPITPSATPSSAPPSSEDVMQAVTALSILMPGMNTLN